MTMIFSMIMTLGFIVALVDAIKETKNAEELQRELGRG
jgi:hypothetical protein